MSLKYLQNIFITTKNLINALKLTIYNTKHKKYKNTFQKVHFSEQSPKKENKTKSKSSHSFCVSSLYFIMYQISIIHILYILYICYILYLLYILYILYILRVAQVCGGGSRPCVCSSCGSGGEGVDEAVSRGCAPPPTTYYLVAKRSGTT